MSSDFTILVLGLGNTLLSDDGVGVHVIDALHRVDGGRGGLRCIDGGTIGLNLLPEIEAADAVILVDAAELGAAPGTVSVFEGAAMDAQLGGKKRTAHEVAAFDLMATAHMLGRCPQRRALVGIQPEVTTWGLEPTERVRAAMHEACDRIDRLAQRWREERAKERAEEVGA